MYLLNNPTGFFWGLLPLTFWYGHSPLLKAITWPVEALFVCSFFYISNVWLSHGHLDHFSLYYNMTFDLDPIFMVLWLRGKKTKNIGSAIIWSIDLGGYLPFCYMFHGWVTSKFGHFQIFFFQDLWWLDPQDLSRFGRLLACPQKKTNNYTHYITCIFIK